MNPDEEAELVLRQAEADAMSKHPDDRYKPPSVLRRLADWAAARLPRRVVPWSQRRHPHLRNRDEKELNHEHHEQERQRRHLRRLARRRPRD